MFAIKENNVKCLWLLVLISFICYANARQIRYNRYNVEVTEDVVEPENANGANATDNLSVNDENEIEATVREIKLAPYPASGFRPSRAFPLPNEAQVTDDTTTETIDFATTTAAYESEATTIISAEKEEDNLNEDDGEKVESGEDVLAEAEKPKAPYPASGFRPRIAFLLPTENLLKNEEENLTEIPSEDTTELSANTEIKAPYPAAGYRPSKAFLLPSAQLQQEAKSKPQSDNSQHPVCGSSTNPLAPKPLDGEKDNPDSEPININNSAQEKSQQQRRAVIIPVRFSVHPLLLTRPLAYSAPIASNW